MASVAPEYFDLSSAFRRIKKHLRKTKNVDFDAEELLELFMKKTKHNLQEVVQKAVGLALEFGISKENKDECIFLLSVFKYVSENFLDFLAVPEQSSLISVRGDAFGFLRKLEDSLRCLSSLSGSDSDIIIACSELPFGATGSDVFGELEVDISQLLESTGKETKEKTDQRYGAIIEHIELYCYLSLLREFAFLYIVILCVINGNSENIGKGYFKVTILHRTEMVSKLQILSNTKSERAKLNTELQKAPFGDVLFNGKRTKLKWYEEILLSELVSLSRFFPHNHFRAKPKQ